MGISEEGAASCCTELPNCPPSLRLTDNKHPRCLVCLLFPAGRLRRHGRCMEVGERDEHGEQASHRERRVWEQAAKSTEHESMDDQGSDRGLGGWEFTSEVKSARVRGTVEVGRRPAAHQYTHTTCCRGCRSGQVGTNPNRAESTLTKAPTRRRTNSMPLRRAWAPVKGRMVCLCACSLTKGQVHLGGLQPPLAHGGH
jgi:hypothetical protein